MLDRSKTIVPSMFPFMWISSRDEILSRTNSISTGDNFVISDKFKAKYSMLSKLRDTIVDNVIERKSIEERRNGIKSNFEKYIEDRQSVLTIPDAINLISVDYTFSSEWDLFIKPKLDKAYQSKDRFLIIVLLGQKNDATVRAIQDKLQNLVEADDGSKHLENVKIITSKQYGEFLGFNNPVLSLNDKGFKQRFDNYQDLTFNIFSKLDSLFGALQQNEWAERWLAQHNEDWINIYRPQ